MSSLQQLLEKVAGAPLDALAKKYQGSLESQAEALMTQLVPLALAVYETQLKMGAVEAARDILGTVGLLRKPVQPVSARAETNGRGAPSGDPMEDYRLARQTRKYRSEDGREDPTMEDQTSNEPRRVN